jgi:pimeloyl-ACP methyl ester carboxylesterase
VPGLGLDGEAWRPTLDALTATGDVEVVTLPGYGRRAQPGADLSPGGLSRQLLGSIDDSRRVVLAGHSAACQVVVQAARARQDLVAGLVLVGPTTDPRARTWPALAARWLATARHEQPGQVPALLRQYARTGPAAMARAMSAARVDDIRTGQRAGSWPVLVVRGRHDRICPEDWADTLAGLGHAPGSRAVSLAEGAHMVPRTHGPLVASAMDDFLAVLH